MIDHETSIEDKSKRIVYLQQCNAKLMKNLKKLNRFRAGDYGLFDNISESLKTEVISLNEQLRNKIECIIEIIREEDE